MTNFILGSSHPPKKSPSYVPIRDSHDFHKINVRNSGADNETRVRNHYAKANGLNNSSATLWRVAESKRSSIIIIYYSHCTDVGVLRCAPSRVRPTAYVNHKFIFTFFTSRKRLMIYRAINTRSHLNRPAIYTHIYGSVRFENVSGRRRRTRCVLIDETEFCTHRVALSSSLPCTRGVDYS